MLQLEKMVKEEFLSNNKKIKEEDLNEYLNSLKKEELIRLALLQVFIDEEYINFMKVNGAKNKPKKYIIDYITNNLDKILASYIKIIRYQEIEQLKLVIKNNGKQVIFNDVPISIHFISLLKTFSLAKVEYHIKDDSLKFFMPKEFMDVFNNCLKNKKLLELNELNNKTYNYAVTVIDTYGIVTLDKLHELFESQMFKIAKNDLQHIIAAMAIYEGVNIYEYNDEVLLCSLEFYDEDYALNFYHKQKMHYKRYSK